MTIKLGELNIWNSVSAKKIFRRVPCCARFSCRRSQILNNLQWKVLVAVVLFEQVQDKVCVCVCVCVCEERWRKDIMYYD